MYKRVKTSLILALIILSVPPDVLAVWNSGDTDQSLKENSSNNPSPTLESKMEGMLIGSAIGDAAGGPIEFVNPPLRSFWSTTDKKITKEGIKELGSLFRLRAYHKETEPFAQWESYGPAGTITDDTRFKLIFFNTLNGTVL